MGIARRTVSVGFEQKKRLLTHHKYLPIKIKSIGDWICAKRIERNLSPGHLALKMGIAATLVYGWEKGESQPDGQQIEILAKIFGDAPPKEDIN